MNTDIALRAAHTEADYLACFHVMRELRPHLSDASLFVQQITRQTAQGYHLLAAWDNGQVRGLAGYRQQENLVYGRFIYIDDLVVTLTQQRSGLGARLLGAVRDLARQQGCARLVLDTGLSNALAQRFYFRQGMLSQAMRFGEPLEAA